MARKKRNRRIDGAVIGLVAAVALIALLAALPNRDTAPTESTEATEANEPPKNAYRSEAFYREDGVLHYADAAHMLGIDVSVHQGVIDWSAVADSGVEFAILRVGYRGSTVGELYEDEQFRDNLRGAREAGLKVGAYFFSQARDEAEAREEAEYACKLLGGEALELPLYYDWEVVSGDSRVTHPTEVDMTACAAEFCKTVEAAGYEAGVYFNQTYGYDYLDLGALAEYHLWLAEYNETPSFAYHFDCLQYSDRGEVAGIGGAVDMDLLIVSEGA